MAINENFPKDILHILRNRESVRDNVDREIKIKQARTERTQQQFAGRPKYYPEIGRWRVRITNGGSVLSRGITTAGFRSGVMATVMRSLNGQSGFVDYRPR